MLRSVAAALVVVAALLFLSTPSVVSAGGDKGSITVTESKTPGPSATVSIQKPEGLPQIQFVNFEGPQKPSKPTWLSAVAEALKPDSPPALVQNIQSILNGGINAEKPQKPTLSISATPTGTPAPIVIEAPTKIKGNVSITKTTVVDPPSPPAAVNVSNPAFALNVTVIKEAKQNAKPFYQGAQANISVTKFSRQKATNYSYANPASNFSITLAKPGSSSWARNAQGQWTKQQATKGITFNGSIAPPVASGPLDEIVGKRLVCKFPAGSSQQQLADAVEVPAALANAVAASGPYSFIAPPFGLKVFGPGCQVYDWACRSTFQVRERERKGEMEGDRGSFFEKFFSSSSFCSLKKKKKNSPFFPFFFSLQPHHHHHLFLSSGPLLRPRHLPLHHPLDLRVLLGIRILPRARILHGLRDKHLLGPEQLRRLRPQPDHGGRHPGQRLLRGHARLLRPPRVPVAVRLLGGDQDQRDQPADEHLPKQAHRRPFFLGGGGRAAEHGAGLRRRHGCPGRGLVEGGPGRG